MPNPFPGMNPYLESPRRWKDVHNSLITYLRAAIVQTLPPQYEAAVEERIYIVPDVTRSYSPDVMVKMVPQSMASQGGSLAIAERTNDLPLVIPALLRRNMSRLSKSGKWTTRAELSR